LPLFTAVWIEDADLERSALLDRAKQDPIRADPEVAVADQADRLGRQLDGAHIGIDHQIIIAQAMVLVEAYSHT
jgi:hypothetical protein